ncbi:MAG: DUF2339 domain-containing protein [Candidatus Methylomirabilia bacterium]
MGSARGLEERITELEAQLGALRLRLERVEAGAGVPQPHGQAATAAAPTAEARPQVGGRPPAAVPPPAVAPDGDGGLAGWAGTSALLPRVSTVSFLLVVALALRTLTDSGVVGPQVGAFAGVVYAASLMLAGWVLYGRRSVLAPVFAVCGAALLCSIVVETHAHFGSLSTTAAFVALGGTCLFMTLLGERSKTPLPGVVGVLGAAFAGIALTVPDPRFAPLLALLLAASALGIPVSRRLKGDWVGWTVFVLSALTLFVFGVRIKVWLDAACPLPPIPGVAWFPYLVNSFALLWVGQSLAGLLRPPRPRPSVLSLALPVLGCTVAFVASLQVAAAEGTVRSLGVTGLFVAAGLVVMAAWSGLRVRGGAAALNTFAVAAVVLFAFGFSSATGSLLGALPFLSFTAFGLALFSARWRSGGTRVISYFLQVAVAVALTLLLGAGGGTAASPGIAALAAGTLTIAGLLHHRWCRRHGPPEGSLIFSYIGTSDRCAVALLTAALVGGFFLLRTGAFVVLSSRMADARNAFGGTQSVIITVAAMALFALASSRRSTELRSVAILVTLVGAAKVFFYDLVALQGIARVVSVFSFGLLAAVASLVLGRWQRRDQP